MSVSTKFKKDNHIAARRELEYKESVMFHAIKGDKNLALKAKWEAKTDAIITKNIVRDRIQDMKKRAATNLN
jgi:hypothetical protein